MSSRMSLASASGFEPTASRPCELSRSFTSGIASLWPALALAGYLMHTLFEGRNPRLRHLGRVVLGLAILLLALTMIGQGARITAAGLIVGGAAAVGIGRLMESTLFGSVSSSVGQLALLIVGVAVISLAASVVPAHRTTRVDPMAALRSE